MNLTVEENKIQKENNVLIETWKTGANAIATAYKMFGKDYHTVLKSLATTQLVAIKNDRPNKNKTLEEQCNKEQLELVNYLKQVAETGEM